MHKLLKGKEYCDYCGQPWNSYEKNPALCDSCFCPESYTTIIDDIATMKLFGEHLSPEAAKEAILMAIEGAVKPISLEELCEKQPAAKKLLGF